MKWKFLAPALLIGLVFLSACKKVADPEFRRIEKFRVKNFGIDQTTIGFSVRYFNPNNFGVTVKQAEAQVYLDTTYLGKFVQDEEVIVEKNAEFSLPFTGSVPYAKLLQMNVKDMADRDILIRADGSVRVGKAGIFVTKPVHYEGKHKLSEIKL
jgi:LEA14-like dessication related protein